MIKLFIYGTLGLPEVQRKVIGREAVIQPETLRNFEKDKVKINDETYPIAINRPGKKIEGSYIEIAEQELELIDKYETQTYKRIEVKLSSGAKAWVYIES